MDHGERGLIVRLKLILVMKRRAEARLPVSTL